MQMSSNSISRTGENTEMLTNTKPCQLQIKSWQLLIVMTANAVALKSIENKITAGLFPSLKKVPISQTLSTITCNYYFCMAISKPSLKCKKWALNSPFYMS